MATEIKLPRLGQGMESGTIVKWLKSEGEQVAKGEPLYELDTDKVTQEVEADASGVLLKIAVQEGEVEVGRTIAVIGEEGEQVGEPPSGNGARAAAATEEETPDRVEPDEGGDEPGAEKPAEAPARDAERERGRAASTDGSPGSEPAPPTERAQPPETGGRIKASPLARRIARERGIDLASLSGTGPEGRIVAEDVERAAAAPAPAPAAAPAAAPRAEPEVVQLSQTRKTIARRLTEAWQAPVFQLSVTVEMTRAQALRERMIEVLPEGGTKPTMNDLLTKLCAVALVRHPAVNAHFVGDAIHRFPSAHVGIAVAAPAGLVVPVIRDADRKTVAEIAAARADLVSRARDGKLQRADLEGGTFTISNLGMYGVEQFIAVLNPPQAAILAVGAVEERPAVVDGELAVLPTMHATLTCDHRAVDGADGAEFLRTLKALLEMPGLAL
jgi:pyruvate dehydrogenase E2 component (dihydrolipoyllysine-residue acetyltransferase)